MATTTFIFETLCQYLATRPEHTARVSFGPACEQWISSEAFVALNWPAQPLPVGTFALCESCKRDITLFDGDDSRRTALATVEAKVVHPNKNLETQLGTLRGQIRTTLLTDETPATERGAIAYAVWSNWYSRRDTRMEHAYCGIVDATFRRLFGPDEFDVLPPTGMRPIIACRAVSWLGKEYEVSVYGLCATRRSDARKDNSFIPPR